MRLLLYCTKQPHKLYATDKGYVITDFELGDYYKVKENLNGKIVAECDFEVEKVDYRNPKFVFNRYYLKVLDKSCLTDKQMYDYLKGQNGYAIHIKNLHIFDKPRELNFYHFAPHLMCVMENAPQNMCYCYEYNGISYLIKNNGNYDDLFEKKVVISIRPEWLCKILNGEKTIEVRKKVLKEMLK